MNEDGIIAGILTVGNHDITVHIEEENSGAELEDYRGSLESLENHLKDWRFEDEKLKLTQYNEYEGIHCKVIVLHIHVLD
ncbi:MAG: hypothetical protein HXS54_05965 [Theionarchaea archaeon]|nr:hypothetical protein [Theionarchaea archaeon]DBA34804.1 TPA_asm: hypothetical protein vir521_00010 [Caudoviricetes sp. vir521]